MKIDSIIGAKFGTLSIKKSTSTNPFESNSFKGKTFGGSVLPFADVFQAIKPAETPKPTKLAMLAGAMADLTNGFKSHITEPIKQFAHRVKENITLGIDKIKNVKNSLVAMKNTMHDRITQVFDWHKAEEPKVGEARILSLKHINEKAEVKDLKATWIAENAKLSNEEGKAVA